MELTIIYNPRLEVEKIKNLEEDMLMIRMMRTEIAWSYNRLT